MKRIFTLKSFAFLCLIMFGAATAIGQAPSTCSASQVACTTTQASNSTDFNTNNGGFTGSNSGGGAPLAYSSANGDFRAVATRNSTGYTLKSRNFFIPANANVTTVGFLIEGVPTASRPSSYTVEVVNSQTNIVLATCNVPLAPTGNTTGYQCLTITDNDLRVAGTGQNVYYRITFTIQDSQQGAGTLAIDNFVTGNSEAIILTPTPVSFTGFEGRKTSKGTELTWKVAAERNVKAYEVERSTWGNSGFAKIGSVPATGSSSYSFTDEASANGAVFYRIRNVDDDGSSRYSTVLHFKNGTGQILFKVVPTVVVNKTSVQHPLSTATALITLSTADGKLVRSLRPAARSVQTDVDLSGLRAGLYLLKWSDGAGTVETTKLVKQ